MKYQKLLPKGEYGKWLEIQVSLGKNHNLISRDLNALIKFLNLFSQSENRQLEKMTSLDSAAIKSDTPMSRDLLRILLIKKFIDDNNPGVIASGMGLQGKGIDLQKAIFLDLAKELFGRNKLPIFEYKYCTFRKYGKPTTWLQITGKISESEIVKRIEASKKPLCRRLTLRLNLRRRIRLSDEIDKHLVYFIDKPSRANVARAENRNREVNGAVYSLLIVDLDKKRMGYVSRQKREVYEAYKFIKTRMFPDQIFTPRKDVKFDGKDLLKKLIHLPKQSDLEIVELHLKRTELPGAPSLHIKSSDDRHIGKALTELRPVCDDLDISQLKTATYQFLKHKISIYSYGDEWKRRFINLVSRGKSEALEANALDAFKELLGVNFKEVRFLVEDWGVYQIIEKLLKTKRIRTEPAIPEIVEKVLTNLVKAKIFKNPTKMAQRICYSCRAISWQDWQCPKCTRDMIIIGQEIQIRLSETDLVRHLFNTLSGTYSKDYEIHNKFRQRRGIKKRIVEITNRKTKVTTYVLLILERKDLEFLSELEKEGHGLICFYDLALANREMQILSYDSEAIPLTYLIASLHAIINSTKSEFATEFEKYLSSQESRILDRIYTKMQYSIRRLKEGKSYNEDMFEVDIKNIIQGLVPDVVRLGTEFKGKPVPDGYCGFKTTNVGSKKRLFGWDAKYSQSRQYALSASDLNKQKKYISWLTTTPEPKSLGKLYLYTIISNYDSLNGFKRVLHRLSRWSQKPRMCRILLLNTDLLINLAVWKLRNWKKVLENGPDIAKVFFSWLSSNSRNKLKRMKWRYSDASDWIGLEKQLDKI